MKCVICHSEEIKLKTVNEQLTRDNDLVLAPIEVLVCSNCGERYYDRRMMQKLEQLEDALEKGSLKLEPVGEVLKAVV